MLSQISNRRQRVADYYHVGLLEFADDRRFGAVRVHRIAHRPKPTLAVDPPDSQSPISRVQREGVGQVIFPCPDRAKQNQPLSRCSPGLERFTVFPNGINHSRLILARARKVCQPARAVTLSSRVLELSHFGLDFNLPNKLRVRGRFGIRMAHCLDACGYPLKHIDRIIYNDDSGIRSFLLEQSRKIIQARRNAGLVRLEMVGFGC